MIQNISQEITLHSFILFGSQARGNTLPHSDYDIVIIGEFSKPYLERLEWIIKIAPLVAIDLFCYTPEEFDRKFKEYNLTAIDAIDEGIFLFDDGLTEKYVKKLEFFKEKGMKKGDHILHPPAI